VRKVDDLFIFSIAVFPYLNTPLYIIVSSILQLFKIFILEKKKNI